MMRLSKRMVVGAAAAVTVAGMLSSAAPARATAFPGPDDFGYTGSAIGFDLRDVSSTGTFVPLLDDQVSGAIALPFTFTFYGIGYNQLFISSNGFVTFDPTTSHGCCDGQPLPQADPYNNLIAGFWVDLNNPQGNIRYQTLGDFPNREFVIGFYAVPHYLDGPRVTFEMILHENGDIELQYSSAPRFVDRTSVGIENADGTIGLQVAFGNDVSFNNQGFLITLGVEAFACEGFAPPFDVALAIGNRVNRAIPVKAQLVDGDGFLITDLNIDAPPVVNVSFTPGSGGEAQDLTDELAPIGTANRDNIFRFDPGTQTWVYNLGTQQYKSPGTYVVSMRSGDESSYIIDPTCRGEFQRLP
jgi:hypothetical protein